MIEINLLPGAGKKKASSRKSLDVGSLLSGFSGRARDKFMIAAVASVVVAVGAVAVLYLTQTRKDAELTAHQERAVRDSTRYANLLKDRYRAESTRDTLLRQVNIIRSLDDDRFVWPHIMDEVSRALPQYTWLTSLGFIGTPQGSSNVVLAPKDTSKKGNSHKRLNTEVPKDNIQFRLVGRTVDIQALTRYMRDLETSPYLSNVVLERSEPAVDNGKDVTQFQLTVNYSRPDTTMMHRVPLIVSVK